jgi:hypothetical protein
MSRKKSIQLPKRVEILHKGIWEQSIFDKIEAGNIFRFRTRKGEPAWNGKELFAKDAYAIAVWDEPYGKGRRKGQMRRVVEISTNGESKIRARATD